MSIWSSNDSPSWTTNFSPVYTTCLSCGISYRVDTNHVCPTNPKPYNVTPTTTSAKECIHHWHDENLVCNVTLKPEIPVRRCCLCKELMPGHSCGNDSDISALIENNHNCRKTLLQSIKDKNRETRTLAQKQKQKLKEEFRAADQTLKAYHERKEAKKRNGI